MAGFFVVPLAKQKAQENGLQLTSPVVTPVMVVPVMMTPVMMMPAVVTPMVMVVPVHLHRLHLVDFILRHDRLLDVCRRHGCRLARKRRDGSSLRACGKHDCPRDQSGTDIQEIPKFHDVMPFSRSKREDVQSRRHKMNVR